MKYVFASSFAVIVGFITWLVSIIIFMQITGWAIGPSGFFSIVGALIAGYFSSLIAILFTVIPTLEFLLKNKQSFHSEYIAIIILVFILFFINLYLMFVIKTPLYFNKSIIILFSLTSLIPFFMMLNDKKLLKKCNS